MSDDNDCARIARSAVKVQDAESNDMKTGNVSWFFRQTKVQMLDNKWQRRRHAQGQGRHFFSGASEAFGTRKCPIGRAGGAL